MPTIAVTGALRVFWCLHYLLTCMPLASFFDLSDFTKTIRAGELLADVIPFIAS